MLIAGFGWLSKYPTKLYSSNEYLLPELCDGGSKVSGIHSPPECLVLAEGILHTIFCVPFVVAACPGKLWLKALEQVVQAPGQNHNVVDVQQRNDHYGRIADTCTKRGMVTLSQWYSGLTQHIVVIQSVCDLLL